MPFIRDDYLVSDDQLVCSSLEKIISPAIHIPCLPVVLYLGLISHEFFLIFHIYASMSIDAILFLIPKCL